jgi:hypothetical protein
MESFRINVDVQGEEIAFLYQHRLINKGVWTGVIVDECMTVEERLTGPSADKCLDGLVPFLAQLGPVKRITFRKPNGLFITRLLTKLHRYPSQKRMSQGSLS